MNLITEPALFLTSRNQQITRGASSSDERNRPDPAQTNSFLSWMTSILRQPWFQRAVPETSALTNDQDWARGRPSVQVTVSTPTGSDARAAHVLPRSVKWARRSVSGAGPSSPGGALARPWADPDRTLGERPDTRRGGGHVTRGPSETPRGAAERQRLNCGMAESVSVGRA